MKYQPKNPLGLCFLLLLLSGLMFPTRLTTFLSTGQFTSNERPAVVKDMYGPIILSALDGMTAHSQLDGEYSSSVVGDGPQTIVKYHVPSFFAKMIRCCR